MTLPGIVIVPPPTPAATPATPAPTPPGPAPTTTSSKSSWLESALGKMVTPWGLRIIVAILLAITWGGATALNTVQGEPAWPIKLGQFLAPLIFAAWMFAEFTVALGEKKILPHLIHLVITTVVYFLLGAAMIKSLGLPDALFGLLVFGMATVIMSYFRKEEWEITDSWKITNKIWPFAIGLLMGGVFLGALFLASIALGRHP